MLEELFITILLISITTSALIIVVLLLTPLLNKIYGSKCKYFIWIILAVRLIISINFSLPTPPIEMTIPDTISIQNNSDTIMPPNETVSEIITPIDVPETTTQEETQVIKNNTLSLIEKASYIWLFGTLIFILHQLVGYCIFKKQIIRWSRTIQDESILNILSKVCTQMKIKRQINIQTSEKVTSPLIIGFFKPILILPDDEYNEIDLELILKHELIHYKRHDIWYKFLLIIAAALHWFNPIVWLMFINASKDIELSCDDEVIKGCDTGTRIKYSEAIMTSINSQKSKKILLTTYFYGGTKTMKQRFTNIFDATKKRNSFTAVVLMIMVVISSSMMVGFASPQTTNIDNIYINVNDCNIIIEKSMDDDFHYNYEPNVQNLDVKEKDGLISISISGNQNPREVLLTDMAIISIPEHKYDTITVFGNKAGVSLKDGIDADFSLTSTNGSMGISIDEKFSRNIDFVCNDGSGSILILETAKDYTLDINVESSSFSIANEFPEYKYEPYNYINGNGNAKITLDVDDSSFSVGMTKLSDVKMESATIMGEKFYLVETEEHLRSIGSEQYSLDKNYMLNADIKMSNKEWISIGQSFSEPFTGTFNGNGSVITGMTMTDPKTKVAGFFGYAQNATLQNITLSDCDFSLAGSDAEPKTVGAIVAITRNCTIDDNIVNPVSFK